MIGTENRLRLLSLAVLVVALALVARLYRVQIVSGETYRQRAEHQYVVGAGYFDRGSIYFSTKDGTRVPAASVRDGFTLALNTRILGVDADLEAIYERINPIIPLDKAVFLVKARKPDDPYEELAKRLSKDQADRIRELKIPGVTVVRQRWRAYPGERIAAHALGLIGYQGNTLSGRYGLERQYEGVLGRTGDDTFVNFFAEIFSNIKKTVIQGEELEGDVVITIEPSAQTFLETELGKLNEKYSSNFTAGIIVDPNTGEIIAMAIQPSFDPDSPQSAENSSVFRNKLVEDRYEMGSIIKPLTLAAGIDSGSITARTAYSDPGCMTLNSRTFCNYDGKSRGSSVTMQEALSQSLNTGMAFAVSKMGNKKFADYMFAFGIGGTTGIDLPNEGKNLVSNLNTNRDLEHAQASFGQGIALTPITTVRALSALANGGTLITPHLAKEIRYKVGTYKTITYPPKEEQKRVISEATSEEISRMLTEVVDRSLRLGTVRLENYSVAAKTGTAQIAREGGGGYYDDRFLHSFFGYFPSYDPRFLIFMYTYDPRGARYASETMTDTFMNTVKFLINYYNIPPDREAPPSLRQSSEERSRASYSYGVTKPTII